MGLLSRAALGEGSLRALIMAIDADYGPVVLQDFRVAGLQHLVLNTLLYDTTWLLFRNFN